ncbi:hypothetical protein FSP39_016910 [Pinctada imbricata]|uniref:Long-chain-fatty-acid--CoA ligase n=1 Tax=Pinctada imbricata TaxID=66713 RepID=A0AA88Y0V8_PINIB|nr:hypothetical protein FSP39_016910 [Pinctada imbricata]
MLPVLATALGAAGVTYLGAKYFTPWVFEDIKMIKKFKFSLDQYYKCAKENRFLIDIFESMVLKHPDKVILRYEDESYTFRQINDRANQCAHAFLSQGVKPGDVLAIMMQNEPQFVWTYLGFLKIGVQLGFINFNQRHKTLVHSIKSCEAQYLIVGADPELENAVMEIQDEIGNVKIYTYTSTQTIPKSTPLVPILEKSELSPVEISYRSGIKLTDASVFIFTSGTTGLPKAAIVTHDKAIKGCFAMWSCNLTSEDVLYEPLPMYHSAAALIGVGNMITLGEYLAKVFDMYMIHHFPC